MYILWLLQDINKALCILWSGVLGRSFGVDYWSGNTLVLFIIRYSRTCVKVKNEWLTGLTYQIYNCLVLSSLSGEEWSQTLEWQMFFCSIHQNIARHMKTSKECDQVKAPVLFWNSETSAPLPPRPLVTSAPSHLGPTTTSAPVWKNIPSQAGP